MTSPNDPTGERSQAGVGNGHHLTGSSIQVVDGLSQHVKLCLSRGTSLVAWSPAGHWIASVRQKTISLWDVEAGALRCAYRGHMGWWTHVTCMSWAPSGREIASGDSIGAIHIWRVQDVALAGA